MIQKYFSFSGRLNRKAYWMFLLKIFFLYLVILGLFLAVYSLGAHVGSTVFIVAIVILVFPVAIAVIIATVSVTVRRFHDRDKSAWWLVPFYLVPGVLNSISQYISGPEPGLSGPGGILQLLGLAISFWAFVELGFLKGTNGSNRFGPDPLADD